MAITHNRLSVSPPNGNVRVEHATRQGDSSSQKSLLPVPGYLQIFDVNLFMLLSCIMEKTGSTHAYIRATRYAIRYVTPTKNNGETCTRGAN